jgi:hypothetical protein
MSRYCSDHKNHKNIVVQIEASLKRWPIVVNTPWNKRGDYTHDIEELPKEQGVYMLVAAKTWEPYYIGCASSHGGLRSRLRSKLKSDLGDNRVYQSPPGIRPNAHEYPYVMRYLKNESVLLCAPINFVDVKIAEAVLIAAYFLIKRHGPESNRNITGLCYAADPKCYKPLTMIWHNLMSTSAQPK